MKSWTHYTGNHEVAVQELRGKWLAHMGLKGQIDPSGSTAKQKVFDDVKDALRWVGYPIDIEGFDVPASLKGRK